VSRLASDGPGTSIGASAPGDAAGPTGPAAGGARTARPVGAATHPGPWAVGFAILAAATTLRPPIVAIGPLTPAMTQDLGVSYGAIGLLGTATVLLVALASPLGPALERRLGARSAMAWCMAALLVVGLGRALAPGYELVLLGSAAIGLLVGMGQSLPQVLARQSSLALRLGSAAFTLGMVGGSIAAAALAVPLADAFGGWRAALVALALPVTASLVVWLALVRRDGPRPVGGVTSLPWRSVEAWWLAVAFGLQAALYHGSISWLPAITVERGSTPVAGGQLVALLNVTALLAGLALAVLGGRLGPASRGAVAVATVSLVALVSLASDTLPVVGVALLGVGLGAILPLQITVALERTREPAEAGRLTAFVFLVGYLMAGLAPGALGSLRDLAGDFGPSLWVMVAVCGLLVLATLRVHHADRSGAARGA
jgi:MFS transporter, CP family, cyanate transporter